MYNLKVQTGKIHNTKKRKETNHISGHKKRSIN